MEKYYKQFENCLQNEPSACRTTCPFGVDILEFNDKMAKKRYNIAYKTLRNSVLFPEIVAELCPQYCGKVCPRKDIDEPVQINILEKTCVAKADRKESAAYNVPAKNKNVAVIGAGISGLACALKLCNKKYNVSVYEKTDRLGGQLWNLMSPEIFLEDIERQFKSEEYELHLNSEIKNIEELTKQGFDAVYIATGSGGKDFGTLSGEGNFCFISEKTAFFAGGSLTGKDVMYALADGIAMAWAMEVYFQTGKLEYPVEKEKSRLNISPERFKEAPPVTPKESGIFTDEEVVSEVNRCARCRCDACMSYCHICAYLNKWPLQMRDEIMQTTMASTSTIHKTPAIRLLNMCTGCGLCETGCPGGIKLGEMIREARYKLNKLGKMPGAYHQFWIQDMEFSNSRFVSIVSKAPGNEDCKYAFFPGCHIGGADSEYVAAPYKWLLSKDESIGLMLRCCGIPAEWAGEEDMHIQELKNFESLWESIGKPTLIAACPSCIRHIQKHLPHINMISLYEMLEEHGITPDNSEKINTDEKYSVFDPCSSEKILSAQNAVRVLAQKSGIIVEELPESTKGLCCGFGGHSMMPKTEYAGFVAKKCGELSENPYLVYCINCRDVFRKENKAVRHILDILFDIDLPQKAPPNVTQRRKNRIHLKERLLKEVWGEDMAEKPEEFTYELLISEPVQEKMNTLRLLEEDIHKVLEFSLKSGRRTFEEDSGVYTCYKELGAITCWLQYKAKDDVYEIVNMYTHRMKIELEGVWNGRKTDVDL